jgi:hypothetical protein
MTMTLLFKVLNNPLDNDLVFYGLFIGVAGAIGYSFISEILRKSYEEKGVQTDVENNLSDNPSQIIPDDVSSIDTLSPVSSTASIDTLSPVSSTDSIDTLLPLSSTFKDTSSLIPTLSEVGTQTIAGEVTPANIEVIPNQEIVGRVIDLSNAEYIAAKVEQLNALDPFSATPWTPDKVSEMIDILGIVNNLFN